MQFTELKNVIPISNNSDPNDFCRNAKTRGVYFASSCAQEGMRACHWHYQVTWPRYMTTTRSCDTYTACNCECTHVNMQQPHWHLYWHLYRRPTTPPVWHRGCTGTIQAIARCQKWLVGVGVVSPHHTYTLSLTVTSWLWRRRTAVCCISVTVFNFNCWSFFMLFKLKASYELQVGTQLY